MRSILVNQYFPRSRDRVPKVFLTHMIGFLDENPEALKAVQPQQ